MSLKKESLSNCHFRHLGRLLHRHFLSLLGPHLLIQKSNVFISRSRDEPKLLLLSYLMLALKSPPQGVEWMLNLGMFILLGEWLPSLWEVAAPCLNRQSLGWGEDLHWHHHPTTEKQHLFPSMCLRALSVVTHPKLESVRQYAVLGRQQPRRASD